MIFSLKTKIFLVVSAFMLIGLNAYAQENTTETTNNKNKEIIERYLEETAKLRDEHVREQRELHLKYVNELYDRKLEFNKEMKGLWEKENPQDFKSLHSIKKKIKGLHKSGKKSEGKMQDEFEKTLRSKNKEFRKLMIDKKDQLKNELK